MNAATTLPSNPDKLWRILPRSATQLERDLLTVTSSDDLRTLFKLISGVKRGMEPDNWLPILLTEYGFAAIAKEHLNWRPLLTVSKALRGKWGTPYAVEEMAKLLLYVDALIWEEPEPRIHFSEFQMDLGTFEPDLQRLLRLRRMVNVIKPARGRFRRIFNAEWDERQHIWDESFWGCFWDRDSGVDLFQDLGFASTRPEDQFLVSLGRVFHDETAITAEGIDSIEIEMNPDVWVDENGAVIVDGDGEPILLT